MCDKDNIFMAFTQMFCEKNTVIEPKRTYNETERQITGHKTDWRQDWKSK